MTDGKARIDELAALVKEFGLAEASWETDGLKIAFKKRRSTPAPRPEGSTASHDSVHDHFDAEPEPVAVVPEVQAGSPVTSPMNGIFYTSPSPNAPAFVKEGDTVTAGQVVGLIEAMKVFNEITSNFSGTVRKVSVETGHVVQPGDVLMYIG